MINAIERQLEQALKLRGDQDRLRSLEPDHTLRDFCSNDYLGWIHTRLLDKALEEKVKAWPDRPLSGSSGSRLLSGNTSFALQLEEKIASFHQAPAALLFNSGYDANTGFFSCIAARQDSIIYDELCHASIIDGIRLSAAGKKFKFRHNDMDDLQRKLKLVSGNVIIAVESVYSMNGDLAPLSEILAHAGRYGASLVVDEAHATGVIGKQGKGLVSELKLEDRVFARIHTFGKALACHGAVVLGSTTLRDFLINFARSFIYTTALPFHTLLAIQSAYEHLEAPAFSNERLHENIAYFRRNIFPADQYQFLTGNSPIQSVVVGGNTQTKALAHAMYEAGLHIKAILSPTVAEGKERLRICLHSFNTQQEIDHIFEVLKSTCR